MITIKDEVSVSNKKYIFRKKKKKDKERDAKKRLKQISSGDGAASSSDEQSSIAIDRRTPAELAFEKAQQKRVSRHVIFSGIPTYQLHLVNALAKYLRQKLEFYIED